MTICAHPEKVAHLSWGAAMAARDSLEAVDGMDIALRPYRCGDHWHLGHKGRSRKSQLRRAIKSGRTATRLTRRRRKR